MYLLEIVCSFLWWELFLQLVVIRCTKFALLGVVIDFDNDVISFAGGGVHTDILNIKSAQEAGEYLKIKFTQWFRRYAVKISTIKRMNSAITHVTTILKDGKIIEQYYYGFVCADDSGFVTIYVDCEHDLDKLCDIMGAEFQFHVNISAELTEEQHRNF